MSIDNISKAYFDIILEQTANKVELQKQASFPNGLDSIIEQYGGKPVTKDTIVELLSIAVNDEILAAFNYFISYFKAMSEGRSDFTPEFDAHKSEEIGHAEDLIERLKEMDVQILTTPLCSMTKLTAAGDLWKQEDSVNSFEIIKNRYDEEVNAIKFYSFILKCIHEMKKDGEFDSTTERLIKKIKADEEEHEKDLRELMREYDVQFDEAKTPVDDDSLNDEDDENTDENE